MLIIDPRQGRRAPPSMSTPETRAPRGLRGSTCLFSNSKPNAFELLSGVSERLTARTPQPAGQIFSKSTASLPAPDQLIEEIASHFETAILAIAD